MQVLIRLKSYLPVMLLASFIGACSQAPVKDSQEQAKVEELPNWMDQTDVISAQNEELDLPPALKSLFNQADEAFYQEDYTLALSRLERAQRIAPRNASIYYRLSVIRLKQQQHSQAEQLALKSLSLSQTNRAFQSEVWLLIAASRAKRGDYEGEQVAIQKSHTLR